MRIKLLIIGGLLLAVAGVTQAAGDAAAGEKKAATCLGCHAIEGYRNGYPSFHVPKLAGQHAQYIVSALKAYRSGERSHPTMHAQASTLSDQDIQNIAAFIQQAGQ